MKKQIIVFVLVRETFLDATIPFQKERKGRTSSTRREGQYRDSQEPSWGSRSKNAVFKGGGFTHLYMNNNRN